MRKELNVINNVNVELTLQHRGTQPQHSQVAELVDASPIFGRVVLGRKSHANPYTGSNPVLTTKKLKNIRNGKE